MKKVISFVLSLLLLFSFASCGQNTVDETTQNSDASEPASTTQPEKNTVLNICLPFYANDSINPFITKGNTNKSLSGLVCGSLFSLDSNFNVAAEIAEDYTLDGNSLSVTLKQGVAFSDGSTLSSDDVVFSFEKAKESPSFKSSLAIFTDVSVSSSGVIFHMKEENTDSVSLLSFPIVKKDGYTDEIYLGTGPYALEKTATSYKLIKNRFSKVPSQLPAEISLTDIGGLYSPPSAVKIGELSFVYNDGTIENQSDGAKGVNVALVPANNLTFIGLNQSRQIMTPEFRVALNSIIDKKILGQLAYDDSYSPADKIFNPAWYRLTDVDMSIDDSTADLEQVLNSLGYTKKAKTYVDEESTALELTMLVQSDKIKLEIAKNIQKCLESVGIGLKIKSEDKKDFNEKLREGSYDMYLAEIRLTPDMDLSSFFSADGSARFGIDKASLCATSYSKFRSGKMNIRAFIDIFSAEMPFIPLFYRFGQAYYSRSMSYEGNVCDVQLYHNFATWSVNV